MQLRRSSIQAIIFDFNGIICDDEPIHFEALKKVLSEVGISITGNEYSALYLGRDDGECFSFAFQRASKPLPPGKIKELTHRKTDYYLEQVRASLPVFPGVLRLIEEASAQMPLAVASGAPGDEVRFVLERLGILTRFQAVLAAEDVHRGKPAPDIFVAAWRQLNQKLNLTAALPPESCLVIEDSIPGIAAAVAAGMKCLAVATSHPPGELASAHRIVPRLNVSLAELLALFED